MPPTGAALSLRLPCCTTNLPARVLTVDGNSISITAPVHLCGTPEANARLTAVWEGKTGFYRATGVVASKRQRPPSWVVALHAPIERLEIEPRYPDDSAGTLDVGASRLPARIVDRSLHGVACVVPALTQLRPGQRVRVIVGQHNRAGTIANVRPLNNQLRVGIHLDDV
jgi:hypothetical protein